MYQIQSKTSFKNILSGAKLLAMSVYNEYEEHTTYMYLKYMTPMISNITMATAKILTTTVIALSKYKNTRIYQVEF